MLPSRHPDHQSIFGDTYEGVPSPRVPHLHPYPTRYHGPIFNVPRFGLPYRQTPYVRSPYAGPDDPVTVENPPPEPLSKPTAAVVMAAIGLGLGALFGGVGGLVRREDVGSAALSGALGGALVLGVMSLFVTTNYDGKRLSTTPTSAPTVPTP